MAWIHATCYHQQSTFTDSIQQIRCKCLFHYRSKYFISPSRFSKPNALCSWEGRLNGVTTWIAGKTCHQKHLIKPVQDTTETVKTPLSSIDLAPSGLMVSKQNHICFIEFLLIGTPSILWTNLHIIKDQSSQDYFSSKSKINKFTITSWQVTQLHYLKKVTPSLQKRSCIIRQFIMFGNLSWHLFRIFRRSLKAACEMWWLSAQCLFNILTKIFRIFILPPTFSRTETNFILHLRNS